ncbi:MAG: phytoene/squalene synthase family protein [Planctomycetes bacterium]|nr:phytoene/squalene synthase family protein [Planctomycetota bacterium]
MNDPLEASFRACQQLTRRTATNFYYSFLTLPRAKRRAMHALYAFMRVTDDIGDSDIENTDFASARETTVEARRNALTQWRHVVDAALAGHATDDPYLPALVDTVQHFAIPLSSLTAVIDGVAMDLDERRYETFDELAGYCEHVASAVGLACIHIWGFDRSTAALEAARSCGIAFQLTNILRDLPEDAAAGRLYLPAEDLRRFDYTFDDLCRGVCDPRFDRLMEFEIARAEQFYCASRPLAGHLSTDGRRAFCAMLEIYHGLLAEIRRRDGDVFSRRVSLSSWRKWTIAARWLLPLPGAMRQLLGAESSGS